MDHASTSTHFTTEDVVDMLDSDNEDFGFDDIIFPGSDDELGFEEVEVDDDAAQDDDDDTCTSGFDDSLTLSPGRQPHSDAIDENDSLDTVEWSSKLKSVTVEPFKEHVGPRVPIPSDILSIFFLLMTSTIWQVIVDQTNLFALQSLGEERYAEWVQITVEELKAYIGFMILMGIVKLPSIYDYWQTSDIFHYSPIASRISRDRFSEISRYLHFVDNSTLTPPGAEHYDRLGKVRGILDLFKAEFLAIYSPHREISIDEAMVPYKGRSSMKQYLPKKPIKRGFKVWMRADSVNGYVSEFSVYTGKVKDTPEKDLGGNVVRALSEKLQNKKYHLYFDNFFSSVSLMINLLKLGLYSCGTLRLNRKGFPDDLKSMAKKGTATRGESKTRQFKNVTVSVWQDTKPVVVIATNCDPTESTTVLRKQKDGTRLEVSSPKAIDLYNKNLGGVDFNDQMRGYYHFRLKCRKNYKYLF